LKFQGAKIWNNIPNEIKNLGYYRFKWNRKNSIEIILKPSSKY